MAVNFDPAKAWSKTAIMAEYAEIEKAGTLLFAKAYEIGDSGQSAIGFPAAIGEDGDTIQEHTLCPPGANNEVMAKVLCVFAERWLKHRTKES